MGKIDDATGRAFRNYNRSGNAFNLARAIGRIAHNQATQGNRDCLYIALDRLERKEKAKLAASVKRDAADIHAWRTIKKCAERAEKAEEHIKARRGAA